MRVTPPDDIDCDNKFEEDAIAQESQYLLENSLPIRIGHGGTSIPPAKDFILEDNISTNSNIDEIVNAFKEYLMDGLYDTVWLCDELSNEQIFKLFNSLKLNPKKQESPVDYKYSSRFLDILLLIIDRKKLEIDCSSPQWEKLLYLCLLDIQTANPLETLKQMNLQITRSLITKINPNAKQYKKIIEYINSNII